MKRMIRIEDYFIPESQFYDKATGFEKQELWKFRDNLKRCHTIEDQCQLIREWRADPNHVYFDKKVLGIHHRADIYPYSRMELNKMVEKQKNDFKEKHPKEEGEALGKKKRKKFDIKRWWIENKIRIYAIGIVWSIITGAFTLAWRDTGLFGVAQNVLNLLHHTPFSVCDVDLESYDMGYPKHLVDENGINRYIPGNAFEYGGYEEEREKIASGYYEEAPQDLNGDGDTDDGIEEDHYRKYKNFTSADWGKSEEERGVGTFGLLAESNNPWANVDPQYEYLIVMRWEYEPFFITTPDNNYTDSREALDSMEERPSRYGHTDSVDQSWHHPRTPIYTDVDYKTWLSQQKFIVINPVNHKSVICRAGENYTLWGPRNVQRAGLITQRAATDLEYDFNSNVELEVYFIPDDLAEIQTGLVGNKMRIYTDGCEYADYKPGKNKGKDAVPPPVIDGDWGEDEGIVHEPADPNDDWMDTITPEYWALLVKYGMTSKAQATACATYVSIMLTEKYGDITPTASCVNLMFQLKNNPNYSSQPWPGAENLQPGAILVRGPYGNKAHGHTLVYTGNGYGIGASLNDHGPQRCKVGNSDSNQHMTVFYRIA